MTAGPRVTFAFDGSDGGRVVDTAVDVPLFNVIGLSRILRPTAAATHWPRAAARALCWLVVALQVAQAARLFRSRERGPRIAYETAEIANGLLCVYKGLVVAGRAGDVDSLLRVAAARFTRCSSRRPGLLRRRAAALSAWLRTFVAFASGSVGLWFAGAWLVESDADRPPAVWAAVETVSLAAFVFFATAFDCCLFTACLALDAHLRTVSAACASVGRGSPQTPPPPPPHDRVRPTSAATWSSSPPGNNRKNFGNIPSEDDYDELINHIVDMQKITKKLDDFYAIVRPVTMVQIFISCLSIITFLFFTLQMYIMGWSIVSTTVLRFFFGLLSLIFQLFIYCYAFNLVDIALSTLNSGLYSCNWTEMDLKFQKTVLMCMRMNSAHSQVIRMTPNLSVNLELFGKMIGLSYRIVSVLVNK